MAQVPQGTDLSTILNSIKETASNAYQDTVPFATADTITDVGTAVLNAPSAIQNEFMQNLYNKIGLTLVDYPVVTNPLGFLKKGTLEYGQTIEDLYVGLATAEPYVTGMNNGEYPDPFVIRKVPHRSAFYSAILSRQYQVTRHLTDLKKAFHGSASLESFIGGILNAMTSREQYDDYRMTVALLARQIEEAATMDPVDGHTHAGRVQLITGFNETVEAEEQVDMTNAFQSKAFLQYFSNQLKKWSSRLGYLRSDLNIAGVENILPKESQRIMMPGDILVDFETTLLAWAYNNQLLEIGGVDEIDAWYSIGAGADGAEGAVVTPDDIEIKSQVADGLNVMAVIYDPGMLKIYNKEHISSTQENAKGNYWNLFQSVEDIYAANPYRNFVYFTLD